MIVSVSPSANLPAPLAYEYHGPEELITPGRRVVVPLGPRLVHGWIAASSSDYTGRARPVAGVCVDAFMPDPALLRFAIRVAREGLLSLGSVLDRCLSPKSPPVGALWIETKSGPTPLRGIPLPALLRQAAAGTPLLREKNPAPPGRYAPPGHPAGRQLLLGPGRHSLMRERIDSVCAGGGAVLLVVPDPATRLRWLELLPGAVAYTSGESPAHRDEIWRGALRGEVKVVIGNLAAALLPITGLALVVVDRSGSPAYAQGEHFPLSADELARLRAAESGIDLLEGSDSFSVENQVARGRITVEDRRPPFPEFTVVPVRRRNAGLLEEVVERLAPVVSRGGRALVVAKRTAAPPLLLCETCHEALRCPRCHALLPPPGRDQQIACPHCAFLATRGATCPRCGKEAVPVRSVGAEPVTAALQRRLGDGPVRRLASPAPEDPAPTWTSPPPGTVTVVTPGEIGTLTGRTGPRFDEVVAVKPESFYGMGGVAAAERAFHFLRELAALTAAAGSLTVYSSFHFHYAMQLLGDEEAFFARELPYREWFALPPFARLVRLEVKAASLREVGQRMRELLARHREPLGIRRAYLHSRAPRRGVYVGVLELHTRAGDLAAAGLIGQKGLSFTLDSGFD